MVAHLPCLFFFFVFFAIFFLFFFFHSPSYLQRGIEVKSLLAIALFPFFKDLYIDFN